jgi:signal transduction histidine kinase
VARRPWYGALGLRGRIVGAVLLTTLATLAVAAVALLGPLESSLRNAERKTLRAELTQRGTTAAFSGARPGLVILSQIPPSNAAGLGAKRAEGELARLELFQAQRSLQNRVGASEVTVLGYADPDGYGAKPVVPSSAPETAEQDPYDDVAKAFRTGKPWYTFGSIAGTEYVRAALPFTTSATVPGAQPEHWVLAVRKPIDEVNDAVATVRNAFLTAALAGAALTLILAIPLAATLVRRLRQLRQGAFRMAVGGPPVEFPEDRARDEVDDLARAFALMQRRLKHQEDARRAFVATASHELRTPLTSLDGMLELLYDDLRSGVLDREDALVLLGRARAQSRRLGRLAADLLDLSRLDAEVGLRSEAVELGELSRAVLAEFELGTADHGIITELDEGKGAVWALGDPGSVARILRILLDNAVRVSPGGATVRVELRNGSRAAMTVSDQGPGVPVGERELIFERFKRGRDTGGQAGFGLGLAIGRELAERMGGELVLEESDGPGARFTLHLPVAEAPHEEPVSVA